MKFLFLLIPFFAFAQPKILPADGQGYLLVTAGINPGDTVYLSGYYKAVAFENITGNTNAWITIKGLPGTVVGDSLWSGGSYAEALVFRNCHYIDLSNIYEVGSQSSKNDANGFPVKTAYLNIAIGSLSDNFKVHDLSISWGGAGLWCKTEVSPTDQRTWDAPGNTLNNFEFYNLTIHNTYNEAMYIGHTAAYWNVKTNTPYYPAPTDQTAINDPATYKRPIMLANVKIHDNYIHDIGNDGIQTSAIVGLDVYNNNVSNWAMKHGSSDQGGILIGGRIANANIYNNYVHDAWGELMQIYGSSNINVTNNLFVNNQGEGISMRGSNGLTVVFANNTVAFVGAHTIRVNGYFGQAGAMLTKNVFINKSGNYLYAENGATVTDNDNQKLTAFAGNVLTANFNGYGSTANGFVITPVPPKGITVVKEYTIQFYSDKTIKILQ